MADAIEVADKAQRVADAAPQARVRIIGLWVWVDFDEKPTTEVRTMLKGEKFIWNRKRGCWQFRGTHRTGASRAGRGYLEAKYGSEDVITRAIA